MRLIEARWWGGALGWAGLAIGLLAAGCRTPTPPLAISGPGWVVQEGQALWRARAGTPELAGDLVIARRADGCRIVQFAKTPLPLVLTQTTLTHWRVEFPPQRRHFAGRRPAPTRFLWLYLPAALAGETLPAHLRFERQPDGGWRLENPHTGETVEGFLTP